MSAKSLHILIIAPSGRLKPNSLEAPVNLLRSLGHKVEIGEKASMVYGPFAGRDVNRLEDLEWALNHDDADLIWMARGGYGLTRIIDHVNTLEFKKQPKTIIGYSDITALFLDRRFSDFPLVHASMLENIQEEEIESTLNLFTTKSSNVECKANMTKIALEAQITGGNLSLIVNQLGIVDKEFFKDKILFIEEIGEYDYKIDRMMVQLDRSGILKNVKALILGQFTDVLEGRFPMTDWHDSLIEKCTEMGLACLYDFPAGHEKPNTPLIFNSRATLKYSNGKLSIDYPEFSLV